MAAKQLIYDTEARAALKRGVDLLSKAVVATLGPKGRNVVLQKIIWCARCYKRWCFCG